MSRYSFRVAAVVIVYTANICLWFGDSPTVINYPKYGVGLESVAGSEISTDDISDIDLARTEVPVVVTGAKSSEPERNELQSLEQYLLDNNFPDAVDLYSTKYDQVSEPQSAGFRDAILAFAEALAKQGEHTDAVALLQEYVNVFYRDHAALVMLARSQYHSKDYREGIETLRTALNEAHLIEDINKLLELINEAALAHAFVLAEKNDPQLIIDFYQGLTSMSPDHVGFRLGLSRALVKAGSVNQAKNILGELPDPGYGEERQ